METIKKNWGFIAISLVCFALIVFMVLKCGGTSEKLNTSKSEYEKKLTYLDGVGKKQLKLTDENVNIAKKNSEVTSAGISSVHKTLMQRFKLNYKVPGDGASALRELKEAILQMQKQLDEKEIAQDGKVEYFSFDSIAKSATLPTKEDLPLIFRQLTIIKEVVKVAMESKVASIDDIRRPMNLRVQEEADYTITPIEITVTASLENGQNFVNAMSNQENFLFFLRTIEISAPDVSTGVVGDLGATSSSRSGSSRMSNTDEMEGGRGRERRSRSENREQSARARGEGLVEVPMKRQELLVYDKKESTWILRFDLIEPKYEIPDEKKAAEEE